VAENLPGKKEMKTLQYINKENPHFLKAGVLLFVQTAKSRFN